ncbi:MAG: amidohydrolase family protein [Verrucomicrobia bacterium]|nr:amidohydrolase family protein [Verrucomicrobiota bacterium]
MKLDAHQHFWRYDARQYPWIPAGTPLQRDWLPADLAALQAPLGLDGSIAVQARQSPAETQWLLGLADADPRLRGVVGWVDLQSETVGDDLAVLAAHPKFVGVRHVVQDEPDDRFLLRPAFLRGLGCLREFGLTYDLLVYPKQLPAAIELVRRMPGQPFVLDHIAKPFIRDGVLDPWRGQIRELALCPNVWCKVSGMVTEARHSGWTPEEFRPYLDVVFEAFGPGRLMFGSDWPVCLLAAEYREVHALALDHWDRLTGGGEAGRAAFLGGTAAAFYLSRRR